MARSLGKTSIQRRLSHLALALHAVAAIAWFMLTPRAFPLAHPRFWLNGVLPVIVLAAIVASIRWRTIALFAPAMWLADAISALIAFPHDMRIASAVYMLFALALFWMLKPLLVSRRSLMRIALLLGGLIGAIAPWLVRPGAPQTHPLNIAFDASDPSTPSFAAYQRLGSNVGVSPTTGYVALDLGRVRLDVAPLLTFISRSIDGAPVVVTPRAARDGPARLLTGLDRPTNDSAALRYVDDGTSLLNVSASTSGDLAIEATSHLPRDVYSHLNSFTEIDIVGHTRLQIAFSPTGEMRFDVNYSDYPTGKPARFAYFDAAASTLRIVEATDAEKGPFHTLSEGPLQRGEPLTITLFDEGRTICSITFDDWSAQASEQISPTAGWRVPANSIVFARYFDKLDFPSPAYGFRWPTPASGAVGIRWVTRAAPIEIRCAFEANHGGAKNTE